jgi:hypothetical protein
VIRHPALERAEVEFMARPHRADGARHARTVGSAPDPVKRAPVRGIAYLLGGLT